MFQTYNNEKALVLVNGGKDSTTCLFWALKSFKKINAISFNYGQKHSKEIEVASNIISETLTCYNGIKKMNNYSKGCGECPSCILRKKGYEEYLIKYGNSKISTNF